MKFHLIFIWDLCINVFCFFCIIVWLSIQIWLFHLQCVKWHYFWNEIDVHNSKLKHYVVYKWPTRNQLIAVPCTRRRDYPMFALEERIVRTVRWPADYFAVLTSAVSQCQMLVLVAYKLICLQHIWLSVTHTGCFFNWASPKFAKCWPVRHGFK